jgi:hypothetical protein
MALPDAASFAALRMAPDVANRGAPAAPVDPPHRAHARLVVVVPSTRLALACGALRLALAPLRAARSTSRTSSACSGSPAAARRARRRSSLTLRRRSPQATLGLRALLAATLRSRARRSASRRSAFGDEDSVPADIGRHDARVALSTSARRPRRAPDALRAQLAACAAEGVGWSRSSTQRRSPALRRRTEAACRSAARLWRAWANALDAVVFSTSHAPRRQARRPCRGARSGCAAAAR